MARGRAGYIRERSGGALPHENKFVLGGPYSLRGYNSRSLGDPIGGLKMWNLNLEYRFPIAKDEGVFALLFFDAGKVSDDRVPDLMTDVYGNLFSTKDLYGINTTKRSIGIGFRWITAGMGTFRFDYGYRLDPREGEEKGGDWEFGIGRGF